MNNWAIWKAYIKYLKQWATDHRDGAFYGMSPECFDEWCDNEFLEEEGEE